MKHRFLLLSLVLVFTSIPASAQMTKFKALFLFNFAKNISWPDNSTEKYFLVTVIGDNELASELKELAKVRKVEAQQLIVKEASTVEAQMGNSQIIYLAPSKSSLMPMLTSYQKGSLFISNIFDGIDQL